MRLRGKYSVALLHAVAILFVMHGAVSAQSHQIPYRIELVGWPTSHKMNSTRLGTYIFHVRLNPDSNVLRDDVGGDICVGPSDSFAWVGVPPRIPAIRNRSETKTVQGTLRALGNWWDVRVANFSVARWANPGCGNDGMNSDPFSNRVQEYVAFAAPYRLEVEPRSGANSATLLRLKPVSTGYGSTSGVSCELETLLQSSGNMRTWYGYKSDCSEATTTLFGGTYTIRLIMRPSGQTVEVKNYVISSAPDFGVTSLVISPEHPLVGDIVTVRMKIKNFGAVTLRNIRWALKRDNQSLLGGTKDAAHPGEEFEVTAGMPTTSPGQVQIMGEVDPNNELNEPNSLRSDNGRAISFPVVAPPPPPPPPPLATPSFRDGGVVLDGPNFHLDLTLCNLDTDADYSFERCNDGPQCSPAALDWSCYLYNFNPPEDLLPMFYNSNGANVSPQCSSSVAGRGAVNGTLRGARPACGSSMTHWIEARAEKGGEVTRSGKFYFTVPAVTPTCPPPPPAP